MHRFSQFVLLFFLLLSFSFSSLANGAASSTTQSARTLYPASTASTKQPQKYTHNTQKAPGQEIVHVQRNFPHFSAINVSGSNLKVTVTGGEKESVVLIGQAATVQKISTTVSQGTFYIKGLRGGHTPNVTIHITTNHPLSTLSTANNIQFTARHIQSHGLQVRMGGGSCINIQERKLPLIGVENNSTCAFVMSGIDAKNLHLVGKGPGGFRLSGAVGNLTARLSGSMRLDAEHLITQHAYVYTTNNSLAIVTPIQALYAFAFQNSNVYYCKTPVKLAVRTQESGNVLKVP